MPVNVPARAQLSRLRIDGSSAGGETAVTVDCMAGPDTYTIARKIRALLDQAESTPYAAEAEAATAKATELMAKYRISQAMVSDAEDVPDTVDVREFKLRRGPYVTVRSRLLFNIAEAFGCESVYVTGWEGRNVKVLGFRSDLDAVDMLFTSLMLQADVAVRASEVPAGQKAVPWRRGFLHGFASEVGDRLEAQMAAAVEDETVKQGENPVPAADRSVSAEPATTSVALVLAARTTQVADEYKRRWPRVSSARSTATVGRSAASAGREAGRKAQLSSSAGVSRGAKAQLN